MSFFYNPHTKQPQIWTYPFFVIVTLAVFLALFFYGDLKARNGKQQAPTSAEDEAESGPKY